MSTQGENTGLQVSSYVEIDHAKLGRHFFDWNSEEQAAFLHGVHLGRVNLGGYGHMQVNYIVESAKEAGTLNEIRGFVELLHEYFKEADA